MSNISLATVKDCDSIFTNGHDVLVGGKNLWIFRANGTFVAKYKTIRNPDKAVFLPGNTVLVNGHGDGSYHYISLDDGKLLWSSVKKGRRNAISCRFAVSPDGTIVYDICGAVSGGIYIDRIIPKEQIHDRYVLKDGLRVTYDIYCNNNGELCLLQSHVVIDPHDLYSHNSPPVRQNGVLALSIHQGQLQYHWEHQWRSRSEAYNSVKGCDGRKILRADFSVLDLRTMEIHNQINDSDLQGLPQEEFGWLYEPERQLLTVYYLVEKLNIVIDCNKRKVVARYTRDDPAIGYQGCLVGNEFWIGTSKGIIKRPFPNMDEV